MCSKRLALYGILGLCLAVAAGTTLWIRWGPAGGAPEIAPEETAPPGRWHRVPGSGAATPAQGLELERVLSLPYVRGSVAAPAATGVVLHDHERTWAGLGLYTSGHAPEAILIDLDGRPLHRWRFRFERAFPGKPKDQGSYHFRRARLLPGGGLVALFQGGGLVRLDRDSKLLWALDAPVFNDVTVLPDGTLLTLTKEAVERPQVRRGEPVLEDSVLWVSPEGRPLRRLSLLDALLSSPWRDLASPLPAGADIFHSNTVRRLDDPAGTGPWRPGNLLVSLRQIDMVMVVDPSTERVVWAQRGPWVRQHEPVRLPGERLLVFDNRGRGGASQVLEIDLGSGEVLWRWPGAGPGTLASREAGAAARLPNGDTLITESERGRAFEVTRGGEVVWEFVSPHRAGPGDELVATLFEMLRVPEEEVAGWLPAGRGQAPRDQAP
jgi:hypothetical protein